MATIKDIAHKAGVSYTTVSNVIHNRSNRVSPATIELINNIIKELSYVPNMSARALVSRSSKVVAIINHLVPNKDGGGGFMGDPFHSAFISSIEDTLRKNGYYLMLRTVEDSDDLHEFLTNWNVDGLFLTGIFEDDFFDTVSKLNKPTVLIDSYLSDYHHMFNVGLQDYQGGYIATRYLIENNHHHIAFACPPLHEGGVVFERLCGYKKALKESGIPFDENLIFETEFATHSTMALGTKLAERNDITAIFATADILAAGIMSGLQQSGRKVPDDISIIGFDDINLCRLVMPMLTTVHQDTAKKGEIAADFMMGLLENNPPSMQSAILPVHLKVRDSVRKL